jgi:putative peptidoglycan lipid II flippase
VEQANKMLKTASFMAIATLLAKLCGMARDMLIASFYGSGIQATAFMTATKLPTTLFDIVIGGVISATFIPVFNTVMQKDSKQEAVKFANKFITMVFFITILITIVGITFSSPLISILAPGIDAETHELARQLSNIMFPMIIFTGLAFSFVGILQSFGEYNIPSIISLISNVAIILYFVLFGNRFGVKGLAVTMLVAWSLQVIVQIPSLYKFKFRFRPNFHLNDPNIKHALLLALPMLVSTWVQPLYSFVNTRIASGIANGSAIALLEYSNRLYIIVVGVFSFVVTNLIYPKLSRANAAGDKDSAKGLIVTSLKSIAIVILPLMAGFIILSKPIISIIYGHGKFTPSDISMASIALACYSFGMLGMAVNEILSKSLFSMQNSKVPMITAICSMVVNIILAYTLSHFIGIGGLALASAGGSTVNAIMNYLFMKKHHKKLFTKQDVISILKTVLCALIMAAAVFFFYRFLAVRLPDTKLGSLIIGGSCAAVGVVVYGISCYVIGVTEIKNLVNGFFQKITSRS